MVIVDAVDLGRGIDTIQGITKSTQELYLKTSNNKLNIYGYGNNTYARSSLPCTGDIDTVINAKSLSGLRTNDTISLNHTGNIVIAKDSVTSFNLTIPMTLPEFIEFTEPEFQYQIVDLSHLNQITYAKGDIKLDRDVVYFIDGFAIASDGSRIAVANTTIKDMFTVRAWHVDRMTGYSKYHLEDTRLWTGTQDFIINLPTVELTVPSVLMVLAKEPKTYSAMFRVDHDTLLSAINGTILTSTDAYGVMSIELNEGRLTIKSGGNELGDSESVITPVTYEGRFKLSIRPSFVRDVLKVIKQDVVDVYIRNNKNNVLMVCFYLAQSSHYILPIHGESYISEEVKCLS